MKKERKVKYLPEWLDEKAGRAVLKYRVIVPDESAGKEIVEVWEHPTCIIKVTNSNRKCLEEAEKRGIPFEENGYKKACEIAEKLSKEKGIPVCKKLVTISDDGVCIMEVEENSYFTDDERPEEPSEFKNELERMFWIVAHAKLPRFKYLMWEMPDEEPLHWIMFFDSPMAKG